MPGDTLTSNIDRFRETALSCPIPPAVELIGEKWAFLILRGAFNGLQHFEEFQAGLGIARNILSDRLGKLVAGDDASYRYLAESIRMHPDQETLAAMMKQAGFDRVEVHNLTAGVVALHLGFKY